MSTAKERSLAEALLPLEGDDDLDPLLQAVGDRRVVLLGEASHGTHEYYAWRDRLSRRLIEEKGFSFIAVEGDWPECAALNRFLQHDWGTASDTGTALAAFDRWPTWMWGNREVQELATWLRQRNDGLSADARTGFYGLDVYSLWTSLGRVLQHLERVDGASLTAARAAFQCFEPYGEDAQAYARATALVPASCEEDVVQLLSAVLERRAVAEESPADLLDLEQNARAALGAEAYYRAMVRGDRGSWNLRDSHMVDTLERLLAFHGPDAKAIVWAHNTHVGDARATPMSSAGMHNVGQLVRQRHGEDATFIVGCAGHRGSVIAGRSWEAPMERMGVPEARAGSVEGMLHEGAGRDGLLFMNTLVGKLEEPVPHRAIGVVYSPALDPFQNYVPSLLPMRYDALLSFDETRALEPLGIEPRPDEEAPETYPSAI